MIRSLNYMTLEEAGRAQPAAPSVFSLDTAAVTKATNGKQDQEATGANSKKYKLAQTMAFQE